VFTTVVSTALATGISIRRFDPPFPGRRVKIQSPGQDSVAVDTAVVPGLGHGNAVSLRAVVGELAELRVVIAANPRGSARK
jgi:hypothetical protein